MRFTEIKDGMKVRVIANNNGGEFDIGTIGIIRHINHSSRHFILHANGDFWSYGANEVEPIARRPRKIKEQVTSPNTPSTCAAQMPPRCNVCPVRSRPICRYKRSGVHCHAKLWRHFVLG